MEDQDANPQNTRPFQFLLRPPQTLHDLPLEVRWEVTRRHPYYLMFWEMAHQFHVRALADPAAQARGHGATLLLLGIGVSSDPPPPSSGPEALQMGQLATAWKDGAVAPVLFRGLAGLMLTTLPAATRRTIGQILLESASIPDSDREAIMPLAHRLMIQPDPVLDTMPTRPIIGLNIKMPLRAILDAVEYLVQHWKTEHGIGQRRRRDDKLADYLAAWDLREGWDTDHYDVKKELSFADVAQRLQIPLRTVADHYYHAFGLICGHEYSFDNWVRLFLCVKLASEFGVASLTAKRRRSGVRNPVSIQPIPQSVLNSQDTTAPGVVDGASAADPNQAMFEFLTDVQCLIANGYTDEQIAVEMGLQQSDSVSRLLPYLRSHEYVPST